MALFNVTSPTHASETVEAVNAKAAAYSYCEECGADVIATVETKAAFVTFEVNWTGATEISRTSK